MREHAAAQVVARAQQIQAHLGVHAVDVAAHPRLKRHVAVRLHEKRVEEHLAELPVAHPRLALGALVERRHVDEHRRRAFPLEVVGGRVLQADAFIQPREHEVELQQRRIPAASRTTTRRGMRRTAASRARARRPIADPTARERKDARSRCCVGTMAPVAEKRRKKLVADSACHSCERRLVEASEDFAVVIENPGRSIPERSGFERDVTH